MNSQVNITALRMSLPQALKVIKWRNSYRVHVPADTELNARIWRMAADEELTNRPLEKNELNVAVRDISLGGMGIDVTGHAGKPPLLFANDRVRIQLTLKDARVILEGRVRYPTPLPNPNQIQAGIQFKPTDKTLQGR